MPTLPISSGRIWLDPTLYPPAAVECAIAAYADVATMRRDETAPDWLVIEPTAGDGRVVDEFLNYVLMSSLELHLSRR